MSQHFSRSPFRFCVHTQKHILHPMSYMKYKYNSYNLLTLVPSFNYPLWCDGSSRVNGPHTALEKFCQ